MTCMVAMICFDGGAPWECKVIQALFQLIEGGHPLNRYLVGHAEFPSVYVHFTSRSLAFEAHAIAGRPSKRDWSVARLLRLRR